MSVFEDLLSLNYAAAILKGLETGEGFCATAWGTKLKSKYSVLSVPGWERGGENELDELLMLFQNSQCLKCTIYLDRSTDDTVSSRDSRMNLLPMTFKVFDLGNPGYEPHSYCKHSNGFIR